MEQSIIKRLFQKRLQGSITTYVFIMFGTAIILYGFGFTNMLGGSSGTGYLDTANINDTTNGSISDPNLQLNSNPLQLIATAVTNFAGANPLFVIGGVGALVALALGSIVFGQGLTATFLAYAIPIGLLAIFLNYFVFPINSLDENLRSMQLFGGLSVSIILIAFFNLFFVLSIVEFVIGRQT